MKLRTIEKKGDVPDTFVFLVMMFVLAVGLFIIAWVTVEIADELRDHGFNETTEGESAIQAMTDIGTIQIQRGFFFVMVGLFIATLTTSFFTATHRLAFVLYLFFLIITLFVGTYLGNAYEQIISLPTFASFAASQPFITGVMQNIVLITLCVGALSMIITFSQFLRIVSGGGGIKSQL